jgi:peptide/nickel transport system substrate-binding protein
VVEAAYAPLAERAATLDASEFELAATQLYEQVESGASDCAALLADADALLLSAGLEPLPRDQFHGADRGFDSCLYAREVGILLRDVATSLRSSGLDAIAQAYRALSFNMHPVGTGPWRFTGVEDGTRATFDAYDGYWRGRPATPRVEVQVFREPAAVRDGLLSGEIDWVTLPPVVYEEVDDAPGLQFASYPDTSYYVLAYNLRPGMLFADRAARVALELCIDKPATVDAATDGAGVVIYSPIDPISWAFQPDLRQPQRDVAAARAMLESDGWTAGPDGIYARDGRRLAADVYVRADDDQRVKFMDLVSAQVRDCGIDLRVTGVDPIAILGPLLTYPHLAPGTDEPVQAIFLALGHSYDPSDDLFASWNMTSEQNPDGLNFMGYADPSVDRLLREGIATYDQRERARLYRDLQDVLADAQPVLFAWSPWTRDAIDGRLGLTDGDLDLTSRQWWWQLEKLVRHSD